MAHEPEAMINGTTGHTFVSSRHVTSPISRQRDPKQTTAGHQVRRTPASLASTTDPVDRLAECDANRTREQTWENQIRLAASMAVSANLELISPTRRNSSRPDRTACLISLCQRGKQARTAFVFPGYNVHPFNLSQVLDRNNRTSFRGNVQNQ